MHENELIKKVKQGDIEAKEELTGLYKNFILSVVNEYKSNTKCSIDELVEAGKVGMAQAALSFEGDRGVAFIYFALWQVRKRILEQIHGINHRAVA